MKGVLLVNLGTPQSPEPKDVGPFLKQFLMDPLVIDIPALARWILVNLLIVPRRAKASSLLYKKVWGPKGSPLLYHTQELGAKVREQLGEKVPLEIGMRYGSPSLGEAISRLRAKGVTEFIVFPLYPQYSLAATESSVGEVKRILGGTPATFVPAFYQHPAYLNAVKEVSAPYLQKNHFDMVVFSYHGLPERQVKKIDPSGAHCLQIEGCCEQATAANRMCYRHHCYETTRALSARLQLNPLRTVLGFQSRLGGTPWIKPYTDEYYRTLPSRGIKRIAVLCPSFVADCLETLEEVAIRGREEFREHGGEELVLVPSLNSETVWAKAVVTILGDNGLFDQPSGHRAAGKNDEQQSPTQNERNGSVVEGHA